MSTTHLHKHNLPQFFNVFIPHHSSNKMKIPIQFIEHLGTSKGGVARLTGSNGVTWNVELVKLEDDIYFKDGWKVFIKENMIQEHDFLFFTYHGKLRFSVRIFEDATRCQKIVPLRVGVNCNQGDPVLIPKAEEQELPFSAAKPLLFAKMRRYNIGQCSLFRIPLSFTRENSLCYLRNEKMIIRVKESSWILNIIQKQNAYVFCGGWCSFVRDNNIREGDTWVFELVGRLEMVARVSQDHL